VLERNLNGVKSVDLAALLSDATLFQLPTNAPAGAIYELIISVRDLAGNVAIPFRVLITVIRDEPPVIFIANTYIDSQEIQLSTTGTNLIARGQLLQIEGKIEDDKQLEYIQILTGVPGQEATVVNLKGADITLPFDFADPRSINKFRIPDSRTLSSYNLIIKVKDTKNAEVVRTFTFQVR
jgi:hypothetical protein